MCLFIFRAHLFAPLRCDPLVRPRLPRAARRALHLRRSRQHHVVRRIDDRASGRGQPRQELRAGSVAVAQPVPGGGVAVPDRAAQAGVGANRRAVRARVDEPADASTRSVSSLPHRYMNPKGSAHRRTSPACMWHSTMSARAPASSRISVTTASAGCGISDLCEPGMMMLKPNNEQRLGLEPSGKGH